MNAIHSSPVSARRPGPERGQSFPGADRRETNANTDAPPQRSRAQTTASSGGLQPLFPRSGRPRGDAVAPSPRAALSRPPGSVRPAGGEHAAMPGSISSLEAASFVEIDLSESVSDRTSVYFSARTSLPREEALHDAAEDTIASLLGPGAAQAPDVVARLERNTEVLFTKGIDTPKKLHDFLSQAWRHDATLSFIGMGFADGAGYMAAMTAANEKLVAMLPLALLKNPSLLGLAVGVGVGAVDVFTSVVGGAIIKPGIYNDYGGNARLPASLRPDPHAEIVKNAGVSAGLNVAKNLPRTVEPYIQAAIEGRGDHSVNRAWADRIDATFIDGFGGMLAAGAKNVMKLSQTVPYDARMLLRDDLPEVIDKTQASWGDRIKAMGPSALQGAKSLVTSPVPVAVVATVGLFASELFAANASIDLAGSPAELPPDRADAGMLAGKRASSVMLFGLMSGLIEIGAPYVAQGGAYAARKIKDGWQQAPNVMAWAQERLGPTARRPSDVEMGLAGAARR